MARSSGFPIRKLPDDCPSDLYGQAVWLGQWVDADAVLARRLGQTKRWVKERRQLLALPPEVIDAVRAGRLREPEFRRLISYASHEARMNYFTRLIEGEQ